MSHRYYEKHLKTLRTTLKRLKNQYYQYLIKNLPDNCQVHYYPSGYFLWITLPAYIDGNRVYHHMLEHKVSIAPGSLFYRSEKIPHHIRINCSFELNDKTQNALDLLTQYIAHYESNS